MLKHDKQKELSTAKKLSLTTFSSLIYQVITIISGIILPKLILAYYGSSVNGLVASVTQFLSLISFLDLGVGQVVQANLYGPLAKHDFEMVSDILVSGKKFFRNLARIFVGYTIVLAFLYPILNKNDFGFEYIAFLIVIISINSFSQYYFGISYQLLLNSDQRGYVQYIVQTVTIVLNVVCSVALMYWGQGIHAVKLITAIVYLLRPLFMYIYVRRMYPKIDLSKKIYYEPIGQKWSGFSQHIASVVLNSTDTVVLTIFAPLEAVSVYAVYNLVISGVKQLFCSLTSGIQPLLGRLWAKQEMNILNDLFGYVEWLIHTGTVFLFGCTGILIVPFVRVYTADITDYNYVAVVFAIILTLAHACHCIRLPYNLMVLAGGHFKQTQCSYIISAALNVMISIIVVNKYGLVGVAVGTLVSMLYQTIWLITYVSKNLICWKLERVAKQVFLDIVIVFIATIITGKFTLLSLNYSSWILLALKVVIIWFIVIIVINSIFNRTMLMRTYETVKSKIKR